MDSRINYIQNLKDCLTSRNSQVYQTVPQPTEQPSREDIEYFLIRGQIVESQYFLRATKHRKIRLHKWLEYLDKIKSNHVWVKSRNKYIKLLSLMCYCECLIEPFNMLPPQGELPTLRKHEVNKIIDQVQTHVKNKSHSSRKMNQTSQNTSRAEELDIFFSRQTQESKRFQTLSNHRFQTETSSERQPLKNRNLNISNDQHTYPEKKRIYLKQSKQPPRKENYLQTKKKQLQNLPLENKNSSKVKGNDNLTDAKKNEMNKSPAKITVEKQKPSVSPFPPKCKTSKEGGKYKQRILTIETVPKQYWESISNSEVHTPKYLNNYQSQRALQDEAYVEVMSFREAETCDCSLQLLGDNWFSELLSKLTS